MFVNYRGFRVERQGRNRVDVRSPGGDLRKMAKTWTAAIEWIDQDQDRSGKGETREQETFPQATADFTR